MADPDRARLDRSSPSPAGDAARGTHVPVSPTVLRSGPYRFFFFASDRAEPVHVHVAREDKADTLASTSRNLWSCGCMGSRVALSRCSKYHLSSPIVAGWSGLVSMSQDWVQLAPSQPLYPADLRRLGSRARAA